MNVLKKGGVIALVSAAIFAVGCAGQGASHNDMGATCAGEAVAAPVVEKHRCKGESECKAKVAKHHHRQAKKAVKKETVKETTETTETAAKEESDAK